MRAYKHRQATGWEKFYRLFLCLLLLAVLLLAGGFYYGINRRAEIPKEGTLVRRISYERRA